MSYEELEKRMSRVLADSDDDRIPNDTLWYSDHCTLVTALVREVRNWEEEG